VPKITRLARQAHDDGRVSVFIDGEFAFGISARLAARLELATGKELTPGERDELAAASEVEQEYERVLRLLGMRAHSRAELIRKLQGRGVDTSVARQAVARAEAEGYVDDAQFARDFARQGRDLRGWAPARARLELRRRGVAADEIDAALESVYSETDLLAIAVCLARGRAGRISGERESRRRRLAGFLARRGFATDICRRAVDEVAP
jgi:regulatory protein